MQPTLTRGVGGAAVAREAQALLNRVSAASVGRVAQRLAELVASDAADPPALARALCRCGCAFAPAVYAALAAALSAALRRLEGGGGVGCDFGNGGGLAGAWRAALAAALAERLAERLAGGGGAGADDLAARLACPPVDDDSGDDDDAPPRPPDPVAVHGREDGATAVVDALQRAVATANDTAAASAVGRLLSRLGPCLAAGPAATAAAPALDALLLFSEATPCGAGAAACAAARRAAAPPTAPPPPPCAVCAARALRAAGWAATAGPQLRRPAPAADAGPPGSDFTEAALLRDDDVSSACGGPDGDADADGSGGEKLAALRAAVAALPWRQASRTVTVCGVRLTVAQKPRDTRPRAGGAGETGLVLWGAATLLSWHLEHECARDCAGARILELGCGCGLTSVAAALLGADVTATDGDDEVVALAEANAANALRQACEQLGKPAPGAVRTRRLRWGDAEDAAELQHPYDIVIAADVVYFTEANDALLATLMSIADASPACVVLLAHTWRKPDAEAAFFARMGSEGRFKSADVTPADGAPGDPPRPHGTRLLRFWRPDGAAQLDA